MTPSKIAVDIDDTLYSFSEAARKCMREWPLEERHIFARAAEEPWTEWNSVNPLCDNRFLEVIDKVHSPQSILAQKPFPHAVQVLQRLSAEGHELVYISSRADETYGPTWEWILQEGFPTEDYEFIVTFRDKVPLLGDTRYIFDDRVKTLVEFVFDRQWQESHPESPRLAFAIKNDLNCGLSDVPGIHLARDWFHLEELLKEHTDLLTEADHHE